MPFIITVAVLLLTSTAYLLHEYRTRALIGEDAAMDIVDETGGDADGRDLKAA